MSPTRKHETAPCEERSRHKEPWHEAPSRSTIPPQCREELSHTDDDDVVASVLTGKPDGRRKLWAAIVVDCPYCNGLHNHRSGMMPLFFARAFRTCPTTGRRYLLLPSAEARAA
jgi:hypothetical protein